VLGKKLEDIDDEVALLYELKNIVIEFIRQIENADFGKDSDVKLLYEKAKEIETQLVNVDYNGNPSNVNRLIYVTEKIKKAPEVRVVKLPKLRAVTSGYRTFNDIFSENGFNKWQEAHSHLIRDLLYAAPDFMWHEDGKTVWIWAINDWVTEKDTAPYKIIEFEGGLYATAISVDGDDDINGRVYTGIKNWIETSGFELDERPGHQTLCHMPNPTDEIKKGLGYHQLDIFVPIKLREE